MLKLLIQQQSVEVEEPLQGVSSRLEECLIIQDGEVRVLTPVDKFSLQVLREGIVVLGLGQHVKLGSQQLDARCVLQGDHEHGNEVG